MKIHSRSVIHIPALLALLASLLGGALSVTPAYATTGQIHVNTATDELAANGTCSLREAIANANDNAATYPECADGGFPASDSITFDGNYTITLDPLLGALSPSSDMNINGNGAALTIVQASTCDPTPSPPGCTIATYPVFSITTGFVNLFFMTVRHGAVALGGGGILNNGGTVGVYYSMIARNYAANGAAGVFNESGSFTLYASTVDSNVTPRVAPGGGGGLLNQAAMVISYSSISNNSADNGWGGGLFNITGSVSIVNSTFGYNSANLVGGLYNADSATVTNSTFSNNTDTSSTYGGILNDSPGSLTLRNALIANSSGADCANFGTMTGDVNNLIEVNLSCGTPTVTSDPGALTWALNGGFYTFNFAIDASSSAYEAGDFPTCTTSASGLDQRRFMRKALTCDIGAFDFHTAPANDEYAAATTIASLPYTDSIDTVGASTGLAPADPVIACVGGQAYESVWYEYTPASNGVLAANTFGSDYDTVLDVWQGTPGTTSVGCSDDTQPDFGLDSSVVFPVTGGATYNIEVTSLTGFAGNMVLNVITRPIATAGVNDGGTFFLRNANSAGVADLTFAYGWAGPTPIVGDWNADGTQTVGIDDASWFFLKDSNSAGPADNVFQYGWAGAAPIMGDWDGNGTQTAGIFDAGNFFLRNSNSPGAADLTFGYGWAGAIPLAGDWNGNGATTIGIYDSGTGTFFLRNSNSPGAADYTFSFGPPGAKPVVGDWNGDGTTTIGVFFGGNFYLRNSNSAGVANITFPYAWSAAAPVMGDWDGLP